MLYISVLALVLLIIPIWSLRGIFHREFELSEYFDQPIICWSHKTRRIWTAVQSSGGQSLYWIKLKTKSPYVLHEPVQACATLRIRFTTSWSGYHGKSAEPPKLLPRLADMHSLCVHSKGLQVTKTRTFFIAAGGYNIFYIRHIRIEASLTAIILQHAHQHFANWSTSCISCIFFTIKLLVSHPAALTHESVQAGLRLRTDPTALLHSQR